MFNAGQAAVMLGSTDAVLDRRYLLDRGLATLQQLHVAAF